MLVSFLKPALKNSVLSAFLGGGTALPNMHGEVLLKRISELRANRCTIIRDHQGWCGTASMEGTPWHGVQAGAGVPWDGQGYREEGIRPRKTPRDPRGSPEAAKVQ